MRGTWKQEHKGQGRDWAKNVKDKYWGVSLSQRGLYSRPPILDPAYPVRKICIKCQKLEQVVDTLCQDCYERC